MIRQNDIIIRLLKEIRDRLPAPSYAPQGDGDASEQPGDCQGPQEAWDGREESPRDGENDKTFETPDHDPKNARMSGPDDDMQ
jgi:hypothetical protein